MRDFLRFETMLTPVLIQVLFWVAVIFCLVAGVIAMVAADEISARFGGLMLFIFGPLAARIYAEILIVWFRMNDHLRHIENSIQRA